MNNHADTTGITITKRADDVQPVTPDWPARIECWLYRALLAVVFSALAVHTPARQYMTDPDGTANIVALLFVLALALVVSRAGTLLMAYRRYGLTPYDYKVARKLSQGRAMTPEEAAEYQREAAREHARHLVGEVNETLSSLREMDVVREVRVEDDRIAVEVSE